jgi:hypothetical protein
MLFRDGIEDLLYFARLGTLAKEHGDAEAAKLCDLTALCPDGIHYPTEPEVVEAKRNEVARAIEEQVWANATH